MLEERTEAPGGEASMNIMRRTALGLALAGLVAAAPVVANAQYPGYCSPFPPGVTYSPFYAQRYTPPTSAFYFAGSSYSFHGPDSFSPGFYGAGYTAPQFYDPRYPNPGPYFYTPTFEYTPSYYGYYYTPGWFRY
jgi:hypothetical protein